MELHLDMEDMEPVTMEAMETMDTVTMEDSEMVTVLVTEMEALELEEEVSGAV